MHSRSADCVLGLARLISSPRTMLAKMAPGLNSKSPRSWLKTFTPVTSVGSRSGVNWIRRNEQSIDRAMALASIVLPHPGTSTRRCPRPRGRRGPDGSRCACRGRPVRRSSRSRGIARRTAANLLLSNLQRVPPGLLAAVPCRWCLVRSLGGARWPTSYGGTLVPAADEGLGRFYGRKRCKFPESAEPHLFADDEERRPVSGRVLGSGGTAIERETAGRPDRPTPRAAPVRNSRHLGRADPSCPWQDYTRVIRSARGSS